MTHSSSNTVLIPKNPQARTAGQKWLKKKNINYQFNINIKVNINYESGV